MKRKNMAAMVTSIALVGVVAVGGTLALLSQGSNTVTNTFTVGKGYNQETPDLSLDEAPVKMITTASDAINGVNLGDYVETGAKRQTENSYNNLIAGAKMAKDPQFHISESCEVAESWIVAEVNGFNTDTAKTTLKFTDVTDETVADELNKLVDGVWYKVTKKDGVYKYEAVTTTNMGNGVYIYNKSLSAGESTKDLFQQLQVDTFKEGANPSQIKVSGVAVEGIAGVDFDNMKDTVMKLVDDGDFLEGKFVVPVVPTEEP